MMIKRNWEMGSPWKIPQGGEKVEVRDPFRKMEKKAKEIRDMIHLI
jgi:hypothetical protein